MSLGRQLKNPAGPIRPARPRLGPRTAYLVQRILMPSPFHRWLGARIESSPRVRRLFTGTEKKIKEEIFGCRMCGQCALPATGYACPMSCPKELRNGPCGGVGADGSCEVHPEMRCVWVQAYERAASQGRAGDLARLQRPIDHRLWGQSSWVNYWQGRDENLWTDDDGLATPAALHLPATLKGPATRQAPQDPQDRQGPADRPGQRKQGPAGQQTRDGMRVRAGRK